MHSSSHTQTSVAVWGAGGHAKVVADILRLQGFTVTAFLDDSLCDRDASPFFGGIVRSKGHLLVELHRDGVSRLVVAVGSNIDRLRLAYQASEAGFELAIAIHPRAVVAGDATIGPGTVVAAGAVIAPSVAVGANAIINTCASVDHDCELADGVHVSPGVRLAGWVRVGRAAWIGIGAVVRDGLEIGEGALVGAGAVVVKNVPAGAVVFGVPARVQRAGNR